VRHNVIYITHPRSFHQLIFKVDTIMSKVRTSCFNRGCNLKQVVDSLNSLHVNSNYDH